MGSRQQEEHEQEQELDDVLPLERFSPLHLRLNTPKGNLTVIFQILPLSYLALLFRFENTASPWKQIRSSRTDFLLLFPGRGVFSSVSIPSGTIIDTCPVLVLDPVENKKHIEHTSLYHYTYNWPMPAEINRAPNGTASTTTTPRNTQALILGLGSMFNHSLHRQNVGWRRDLQRQVIVYRALRDIAAGEELCISYGDRLTFRDVEADEEREREVEAPEEVLGRIDL